MSQWLLEIPQLLLVSRDNTPGATSASISLAFALKRQTDLATAPAYGSLMSADQVGNVQTRASTNMEAATGDSAAEEAAARYREPFWVWRAHCRSGETEG